MKSVKGFLYTVNFTEDNIKSIINNIDKYYYCFEELKYDENGNIKLDKKGNPKKRVLQPSTGALKTIQKKILRKILQNIELPKYAYGAVKRKDNVTNARKHQGKKHIFTTDLKNFFPSITYKMVYGMFIFYEFSPPVARLLTKLTTYKGRLPQGAPTSPYISNLVLNTLVGEKLEEYCEKNNITFTSFIDDLTFSSSVDFKGKTGEIISILQNNGFKISHNKTSYKTKNPVVTGVVVKNNNLDITPKFKNKLNETKGKTPIQLRGLKQYEDKIKNA